MKIKKILFEDSTRTTKDGGKGTLKRKIKGKVTCAKVKALKNKKDATKHDVSQANWFLNMNCGGATKTWRSKQ